MMGISSIFHLFEGKKLTRTEEELERKRIDTTMTVAVVALVALGLISLLFSFYGIHISLTENGKFLLFVFSTIFVEEIFSYINYSAYKISAIEKKMISY